MAKVSIQGLGKDHGATRVLGEVSLEIADGELLVLVGPSGCGKSTLLRCIAGLDEPTRGRIEIDGVDVTRKEPRDRDIAMVFQSYALYPHLTVRENLAFGLKMRKTPRPEIATRVAEAAAMLGLEPLLERTPRQLSGGQRQRVAIAQQLVRQTRLVLMDEPFSGLDPATLDATIRLLVEVANMDELNTIMVVTHDIRSALSVCDTLFVLGRDHDAKGQIVSGAKVQKTYDLVEMGMAWQEQIEQHPEFPRCEREIKARFTGL
jgi:sn-glycerol 3-phosphate transport system ATP-binding protein/multiple sugar transport system ATP-binding protein